MNPYQRIPAWKDCFQKFKRTNLEFEEIIDVGAAPNQSSFTTEIVKLYPNARYHLIEPQDRFNEQLKQTYNGVDNIIYNEIVGSVEKAAFEVGIKRYDNEGATHILGTNKSFELGWSDELQAEVLYSNFKKISTLDNLIGRQNLKDLLLLKIDVDGQDLEVLKGATNLLTKVKVLQVEASLFNMTEIITYLDTNGFKIIDIVDFCYYDHALTQVDIIFGCKEFIKNLTMFDAPLHRTTKWKNELLFNFPYMI